jgi:hypothetical protein
MEQRNREAQARQQPQQPAAAAGRRAPPIPTPVLEEKCIYNDLIYFKWDAADERWLGVCHVCGEEKLTSFTRVHGEAQPVHQRTNVPDIDVYNIGVHMTTHQAKLDREVWASDKFDQRGKGQGG